MDKITAETLTEWRYEIAPAGKTVWLLTTGFVSIKGKWTGDYGEHFVAWSPMLKRNKDKERKLGLRGY